MSNSKNQSPEKPTQQKPVQKPTAKPVDLAKENALLKTQLAEFQKKLEEQPQTLEAKIKYFQEKQENIRKLNVLDGYVESLMEVGKDVQEESENDEFSTERFAVRISKKANSYREEFEDLVKIKNPVLVAELLGYIMERINTKRDILKTAING